MPMQIAASLDLDEILDLQPFGLRVVSIDRDLQIAVTEEAGHIM